MEKAARLRLQIGVVLTVYRAEMARLERWSISRKAPTGDLDALRGRSLQVLDAARAELDGSAAWHPELLDEIAKAREEVARAPAEPD